MTDRLKGFIVTLAGDVRVDDAERTIAAIRQLRGVLSVEPLVSEVTQHIAEQRVRREMTQRLYDALSEERPS